MALGQAGWAAVAFTGPGLLAFIFAVVAENKKPTDDMAEMNYVNGVTTCNYPSDPTVALGSLAVVFLFISAILATVSFYFPYNKKAVSKSILWRSTSLVVFTLLSFMIFMVAEGLLLWAILVENDHRKNNVHVGEIKACPTAKAGLFGGAGFLALDATLFFLIALMLTMNSRSDYLDGDADDRGTYGEVTTDYPPAVVTHQSDRV
ncbi:hypothetical protein MPTK1_8g05730 [Marchantia polymorpha subsp. ruderalis]|uniref:Uncharacterized protein n=2 Tax=Marchantia polymorpha TaxID=3197 RepID=A0A176VR33_MARPO|nr:hypothetical protein AXG93_2381s1310 [Marchantia polymorpha subsp. ruderalis]PTQ34355.1 hypothetical protein MARPO_0081s0075 [Marchantia polymorpha]PTQ34356.1 hypothetical protein MARPO_0081s0075 [Marchantia polymorpha]PTQ34357.1 hypothetical protein MARPO_0081s0075 [Marchantia polymorpha]BBN18815.1 hypothetical protein Mp_8g05730 [Marchantia polymorpha subsp. ruderalis]|eukprot:PTQ34355.1 hypothetical protein MARPO_0081s0075 [Marchantia polymorpha]